MRNRTRTLRLGFAGLSAGYVVAVLVVFTFLPQLRVLQFGQVLALGLAILGLNVVSGYSGQLSLGHSAFFGLGAYTSTILVTDHSWSILATLPVAAVLGFTVGIVAGLPALRLQGHYLSLVTLGFAVAFPLLVSHLDSLTGGVNGKLLQSEWVLPAAAPGFVTQTGVDFLVVALVTGIGLLVCRNVARLGPARTLMAIRDNPTAAAISGVHLARQKTVAFGISAAIAAVAGSMYALMTGVVSPDTFGVMLGIQLLTGLLVGGAGTLAGPLIGGIVLVFLPTFTSDLVSGTAANMVYGALLVLMMFVLPGGLAGGARGFAHLMRRGRRAPGTEPVPATTTASAELDSPLGIPAP